jgi:peptide/nickel transport system permease protein
MVLTMTPAALRAASTLSVRARGRIAAAVGLRVQPPDPTGGGMIAESTSVMALAPWLALGPEFAIVFVVGGFTPMDVGLRDALDPRG